MSAPPIVQLNKQSLLGLIQTACDELAIRRPTQIFGNTDNQVRQLLALANREGREMYNQGMRIGGWQELRQQYTFSLLPSVTVTAGPFAYFDGAVSISNVNTSLLSEGMVVSGPGIVYDTHIREISSFTNIGIDQAVTQDAGTAILTFYTDRYLLPDDYSSYMTTTAWDRSFRWQLLGPLDAQEWQVLKSGISPTGPRRRFRIMGNYLYIDPPPSEAESMVLEYYSNAWCQDTFGGTNNAWVNDSDYYTLDDDSFVLGLKWRFKAAKGLDYSQDKQSYDLLVQRLMSSNGGARDLSMNAQASGQRLLNNMNVPDTGYGS